MRQRDENRTRRAMLLFHEGNSAGGVAVEAFDAAPPESIAMQLTEEESRVAVAALQVLDRSPASEIEEFAEPIYSGVPAPLRKALDEHEALSYLTMKLSGVGGHEVTEQELSLAVRGLDQYVRLLEDHLEDAEVEDFLLSPEKKARQAELSRAAKLLDRLAGGH